MCSPTMKKKKPSSSSSKNENQQPAQQRELPAKMSSIRQRRSKRDKEGSDAALAAVTTTNLQARSSSSSLNQVGGGGGKKASTSNRSASLQKHGSDAPSGGVQALIPSLVGLAILICGCMAKMGFRGRASVAGIDLGTTNSVICVQAPAKGVGHIDCIIDPVSGSPIVPSVVSFLEVAERPVGPSSKTVSLLDPHPTAVVVGQQAKHRINSHPHHTLYNAKRVLGRRHDDPAIQQLRSEVEFQVHDSSIYAGITESDVVFAVPDTERPILPQHVGAYVIHHLLQITKTFLGHDNIKSAVICVPAKFNAEQRLRTYQAFRQAGLTVARVVEEPTAAALAYGLHRKHGVDYILVYDFGGGTLDISLLHVSEGFVDAMGSDGDDRLGGADFDAAVAHFFLDHQGGQAIVDRMTRIIQQLEASVLPSSGSSSTSTRLDLEQTLSHSCPKVMETPLCSMSSFHTIGEQLKIQLSSAATAAMANGEENATVNDEDTRTHAQCLGLPDSDKNDDSNSNKDDNPLTTSLDAFCNALVPVSLSLSAKEFNDSVQPLLDRSIVPVQRLLADLDLKEDDIDEIVMVGGTSRKSSIKQKHRQKRQEDC
jgi:molecular chaperone DnaK (HSP70)